MGPQLTLCHTCMWKRCQGALGCGLGSVTTQEDSRAVRVHMCTCMHTHVPVHVCLQYAYVYVFACARVSVHVHACVSVCAHTC